MVIKMKYSVLAILAHLLTNIIATHEVFTLSDLPPDSCPIDSPISCSRNAQELENVNSCCYESPAGVILLTQFWDYNPATGPDNLFTQHGLWGNMCSYGYPQFCDPSLEINPNGEIIRSIIVDQFGDEELYNNMSYSWKDYHGKDSSFWAHEYNKHGTCMTTLSPSCFTSQNYTRFENVVNFYKKTVEIWSQLDTFEFLAAAGIYPTVSRKYKLSQVQEALQKAAADAGKTEDKSPEAITADLEKASLGDKKAEDEEEDEGEIDETGLDPKDIEIVVEQTQVSRAKAVKALRNHDGDMVNAIMDLS